MPSWERGEARAPACKKEMAQIFARVRRGMRFRPLQRAERESRVGTRRRSREREGGTPGERRPGDRNVRVEHETMEEGQTGSEPEPFFSPVAPTPPSRGPTGPFPPRPA